MGIDGVSGDQKFTAQPVLQLDKYLEVGLLFGCFVIDFSARFPKRMPRFAGQKKSDASSFVSEEDSVTYNSVDVQRRKAKQVVDSRQDSRNIQTRLTFHAPLLICLLCVSGMRASGQAVSATLLGTVSDKTGASLNNAKVTIQELRLVSVTTLIRTRAAITPFPICLREPIPLLLKRMALKKKYARMSTSS